LHTDYAEVNDDLILQEEIDALYPEAEARIILADEAA